MKITHMRTNHVKNPMGYQMTRPVFSYKVTGAKGSRQEAGQILVAVDPGMGEIVYDSGKREDMDSIAFTADMKLAPRTRYYWKVTVWTDANEVCESEIAWFETGKMEEHWKGKWICADLNDQHPWFKKKVSVEGEIRRARLYISGLGLYEAYLNGEKIGEEYLTPYSNDYDQWIQYQTFDVGEMLRQGDNDLSVLLGNGWYKGRFGLEAETRPDHLYGDHFLLIGELVIEYADGRVETIATDESWRARKSKIMESSFYEGEVYDETFSEDRTYSIRIYEKTMAPLRERLSLPVLAEEKFLPARVIHTPKDELVLDLGQNHSGIFLLKVHEPRGAKLKLYFGEELQDGCFYNGNLRTGKQEYTYISDGSERMIRPHFTTYGYRYVKLEGFTNFEKEDYTGLALYSQLEQTGHLTTGNALVNRLAQNALWGQKSNFLDVPMDCPQRDERMGWTGDAQVFTPTACYNMDCYAFYRKYLYDMYEEQKERNGAVPFCVPACGQTRSSAVWGDAATLIPWVVYRMYGDVDILADQYDGMKAWVDYIHDFNGDDWKWRQIFHFGDWLALDSKNPAMPTGGTDTGFVATVYYYNSARLVAKAAKLLGKEEDAGYYTKLAQNLKAEIQGEYFSPFGRPCIGTQTGLLMALYFDLAPDRERIRQELRQAFKENDDKLETGFVGTGILCDVLSENGMDNLAYSLLLYEGYPGWLYSVKHGATTIWERWDSLDENGHFSESGLNSLNHYSYGSIVGWIYRYAAGLQPMESDPGFRTARIEPRPDYRIGKVEAELDTPVGIYRSAWRVSESYGLVVDITVPFGGTALVKLPFATEETYHQDNPMVADVRDGVCVLKSGTYHIEYKTTVPMRKVYDLDTTVAELLSREATEQVLREAVPMIDMLPESLHDKTFREVLMLVPQMSTPENLEKISAKLVEIA